MNPSEAYRLKLASIPVSVPIQAADPLIMLNHKREAAGMPTLSRYPSDRELLAYFINGEESLKQLYRQS